jgi:hypothetical protein
MNTANRVSRVGVLQRNRWALVLVGLLLVCATLVAWKYYDHRYPNWSEEVRLSDGRVITIHQRHEFYQDYGTNQSWVEIDLPELGGKRVWHSYLMPQRVDVVQGKVYVFGVPRGIRQNQFYRYPKHYLVGFEWSGSEFVRIPFLQVPEALRREENIYPCIPNPRPGLLALGDKEKKWCPDRGDKWKFGKKIDLANYQSLALFYAELDGGKPISE